MDKGFNDDELADIMSEIENLEQEFTEAPVQEDIIAQQEQIKSVESGDQAEEQVVAQEEETQHIEVPEHQEIVAEQEQMAVQSDENLNEVLEDLSAMPVEDIVPAQGKKIELVNDNIHHLKQDTTTSEKSWSAPESSHHEAAHTSMSFKVEGDMKLDLNFCVGGQDIALHVSDHGFEIELAGGAKFTLPIASAHQGKKVA